MKSVGLVQIFCPVKETNRTHSRSYVEDLSTQTGRKRCTKATVLNLSVLPVACSNDQEKNRSNFRHLTHPLSGERHRRLLEDVPSLLYRTYAVIVKYTTQNKTAVDTHDGKFQMVRLMGLEPIRLVNTTPSK